RRLDRQPDADAVHHAGDVPLHRSAALAGAETRSESFHVFVKRHAEKIANTPRSPVAILFVEAHRALQRLGRVEGDAFAITLAELRFRRLQQLARGAAAEVSG